MLPSHDTTQTPSSPAAVQKKTPRSRILAVDDEAGFRALLSQELSRHGYEVSTAENGEEGLKKIREGKFDLVISDMKMPKLNGMEFLEAIKSENPNIEVIMATGFGTIETAVTAMKKGAYDFVQKPFNLPEVFAVIEKALEKRELKAILGVYEASKAIFTSIKLDKLLPIIMDLAMNILLADDVTIMLKRGGAIVLESSVGVEDAGRKQTRIAIAKRVSRESKPWKGPLLLTGPLTDDVRFKDVPDAKEITSSILCPLEIENEFLGVLSINRTGQNNAFTPSDLCNVTIFASQISQAVYNAKLYNELESKITELRTAYDQLEQTQSQLLQSEKLAAIGQLAAGVAHELNNPLTGILGFSEMLLESKELPGQVRDDIESIYKQSQRCRGIIQNLLQFSRRRTSQKEPLEIPNLIEATLQLVQYDFSSSGIDVATQYVGTLPPVFADLTQLEQVFLNLITNARQAMEGRKPAKLTIQAHQHDDKVEISVKDTGTGIRRENLGKIFDPFFTTKPVGQGTGLGLSISYGIIQQHHGTMRVESEEGVGTTFIVELPALR